MKGPSSRAPAGVLLHGILAALVFAGPLAVTWAYVSHERIFYWSDYVGFQEIAHGLLVASRQGLRELAVTLAQSMGRDYNGIFAIPLVPLLWLFGDTRLSFELGLTGLYAVPLALAVGAQATRLIPGPRAAVFWSAVAVTLLTPMTWVPGFRGYPDAAAALPVALAVWLYLDDIELQSRRRAVGIGVLIALAVLVRRHFAYAATAFFAALVVHAAIHALAGFAAAEPRVRARALVRAWTPVAVSGLSALTVMLTIGLPFVKHVLGTNINTLYADYIEPPRVMARWFVGSYGWLTLVVAAVGLYLALRRPPPWRSAAWFVVLFGLISLAQWLLIVREASDQYTLHFTPFVALGLASLGWATTERLAPAWRPVLVAVGGGFLVATAVLALRPRELTAPRWVSALLPPRSPPLTRPDYEQVGQLVGYLRSVARPGDPIFVAASSDVLTQSILATAERIFYGRDHTWLAFQRIPVSDSRDFLPLELLLQASVVVMATPFQQHLGAEKQRVVKVVFDMFTEQGAVARDFIKLPGEFQLADGVIATVYRRNRPTPIDTALHALRYMENYVRVRPGGQLDWILLHDAGSLAPAIRRAGDGSYTVTGAVDRRQEHATATLAYLPALLDSFTVSGQVASIGRNCGDVGLSIGLVDSAGQVGDRGPTARLTGGSGQFAIPVHRHTADRLLLDLSADAGGKDSGSCSITLEALRVRPVRARDLSGLPSGETAQ
jgi:hypothetical protein